MASIKINLVVDRSRNRVLFADTGFDFVDVLLTFLTLPLSTIQSCSAGVTSPGCLSNLCDSVDRLRDSRLLKVEACHGMLLMPAHADEFNEVLIKGSKCCVLMARLLNVYNQAGSTETFVSRKERFVIGDGMTIKSASTSSLQSLPQTFGSDGIAHGFEEVQVSVSWETVDWSSVLQVCDSQLKKSHTITIATVKSRIKDKVSIPARCRHELVYGSRYLKDCTAANATSPENVPSPANSTKCDRLYNRS
ncbi:hypothetical protein ZWY2020_037369 [Hordeum vulgare]|nr:hypothetical protein ZWY2020_037369 [Hordeum vulgare]